MYTTIFENEHFIIVNKDPMVLSVPSRLGDEEERGVLGKKLEEDLKIAIFPCHRLDFEVQGLIIYAKSAQAHKSGNAWFEKKEVHKTYSAVTSLIDKTQTPEFKLNEKQVWKCKLLRGKKRAYEGAHGKDSLTHAVLKNQKENIFYWELNPITGRSHQLRYELYRHNHAIVGDKLYSSDQDMVEHFGVLGIALRSFRIDFTNAPNHKQFGLPSIVEISPF